MKKWIVKAKELQKKYRWTHFVVGNPEQFCIFATANLPHMSK